MGLDTYASRVPREMLPEDECFALTEEDVRAFRAAKIRLVDYRPGGFRGKEYEALVRCITGVSLYQEWIPPEEVERMYQALKRYLEPARSKLTARTVSEIKHLLAFFRVCVERNLGLVANW